MERTLRTAFWTVIPLQQKPLFTLQSRGQSLAESSLLLGFHLHARIHSLPAPGAARAHES